MTRTLALLCTALPVIYAQNLTSSLLDLVKARMNDSSTSSWEAGTRAETLLEIDFPDLSVFSPNYLSPTPPYTVQSLQPVLSIAQNAVTNRSNAQLWGEDGSSGDPASLGVAVLLGNWTNAPNVGWAQAAQQQLNLLLNGTPRVQYGNARGAISHRQDVTQLWSDSVYMVPPFLAYYGAVTQNTSLISEAYNQISLYRAALYDKDSSLWRHIYSPSTASFNDTGHWSTGNGWAAAGMLRVLATIKNSPWSGQFKNEQGDLSDWVKEIHTGMAKQLPDSGMFFNYVDVQETQGSSFPDASGTALFAATVYRHVTFWDPSGYGNILTAAEKARSTLYANNGADHFDARGWLMPVVDPDAFSKAGADSNEAQSFALQLNNNWMEWVKEGSKSSARRRLGEVGTMFWAGVVLGVGMMAGVI